MRRSFVVSVLAAIAIAGCTAPPPLPTVPPPTLPAGVGVSWLRDVGGTYAGAPNLYQPSYDRYVTTSAGTTGPTTAVHAVAPILFSLLDACTGCAPSARQRPDGTAEFPWNGYAGEGISWSGTFNNLDMEIHRLTFPTGTCELGTLGDTSDFTEIMPSPDGTKAAVLLNDISAIPFNTTVRIVGLVDGATCPTISTTPTYGVPDAGGAYIDAIGQFVWSPDSTAIVYPVGHHPANESAPDSGYELDRLDAVSGATPQQILQPVSKQLIPTGWSIAGRLLMSEVSFTPTAAVSTILTMKTDGTDHRTIETSTSNPAIATQFEAAWTFGYYVPGTSTIVYQAKFATVTNSDGYTLPRFRPQLIADTAGAAAGPLDGTPPLVWHQVPIGSPDNPTGVTNAPNPDVLEQFTH
jgi:hypothetical protein